MVPAAAYFAVVFTPDIWLLSCVVAGARLPIRTCTEIYQIKGDKQVIDPNQLSDTQRILLLRINAFLGKLDPDPRDLIVAIDLLRAVVLQEAPDADPSKPKTKPMPEPTPVPVLTPEAQALSDELIMHALGVNFAGVDTRETVKP